MFNLKQIANDWQPIVKKALMQISANYLADLQKNFDWLPGHTNIFNAFTLPLAETRYILFGESPYPRQQSANGYAFWDAAVGNLWSDSGMTTEVNRATSLRNLIKMLMVANGSLNGSNTTQTAIAKLDKTHWVQTLEQLFEKLLSNGFLLLNANLVLSQLNVNKESVFWQPFIKSLLLQLKTINKDIRLILFGKIADKIKAINPGFSILSAEHPYNVSFINNSEILEFFRPFNLLLKAK